MINHGNLLSIFYYCVIFSRDRCDPQECWGPHTPFPQVPLRPIFRLMASGLLWFLGPSQFSTLRLNEPLIGAGCFKNAVSLADWINKGVNAPPVWWSFCEWSGSWWRLCCCDSLPWGAGNLGGLVAHVDSSSPSLGISLSTKQLSGNMFSQWIKTCSCTKGEPWWHPQLLEPSRTWIDTAEGRLCASFLFSCCVSATVFGQHKSCSFLGSSVLNLLEMKRGAQLGLFSVLLWGRAWSSPKDCSLVLHCRISSFQTPPSLRHCPCSHWSLYLNTKKPFAGVLACVRKEWAAF